MTKLADHAGHEARAWVDVTDEHLADIADDGGVLIHEQILNVDVLEVIIYCSDCEERFEMNGSDYEWEM